MKWFRDRKRPGSENDIDGEIKSLKFMSYIILLNLYVRDPR